ncbi:hypothetical protein C2845_PM17G10680 [Panicum miliaceum]|uniref:Uncharacterized protein n=1 Tax=Panicum miliaceum TaxID=4540 RepID=A0A3L6Q5P3_PANMI|nr:hypothetical protein C2845_PM17G10680 [Panicum miliaceum]
MAGSGCAAHARRRSSSAGSERAQEQRLCGVATQQRRGVGQEAGAPHLGAPRVPRRLHSLFRSSLFPRRCEAVQVLTNSHADGEHELGCGWGGRAYGGSVAWRCHKLERARHGFMEVPDGSGARRSL